MTVPSDAPGTDPLATLALWRSEVEGRMENPDAIALGTATPDGAPSVRFVLMRGITAAGVRFFTNYESRKGTELDRNPRASAAWWAWPTHRQVRIEGDVHRIDKAASDAYFASRDRGHQLGALASAQSTPLADRAQLEDAYARAAARYAGAEVPRPSHWGGYELVASSVELWEQRDDRLHDRFLYTRSSHGWDAVRLAP